MSKLSYTERKRESLQKLRERRRAEGRVMLSTDLPEDIVETMDNIKVARGLRGRTEIIEEALRFYIEHITRA